jgi:cbb3-type cytochrome oxidase maturation protein
MTALAWLIPCALLLGLLGLAAFLWSLNTGQFEDLDGAGWRALQDEEGGRPPGSDTAATASGESAPAVR